MPRFLGLLLALCLGLPSPAHALRPLESAENAAGLEELTSRLLEDPAARRSDAGLEEPKPPERRPGFGEERFVAVPIGGSASYTVQPGDKIFQEGVNYERPNGFPLAWVQVQPGMEIRVRNVQEIMIDDIRKLHSFSLGPLTFPIVTVGDDRFTAPPAEEGSGGVAVAPLSQKYMLRVWLDGKPENLDMIPLEDGVPVEIGREFLPEVLNPLTQVDLEGVVGREVSDEHYRDVFEGFQYGPEARVTVMVIDNGLRKFFYLPRQAYSPFISRGDAREKGRPGWNVANRKFIPSYTQPAHVRFEIMGGGILFSDLGSTNRTEVEVGRRWAREQGYRVQGDVASPAPDLWDETERSMRGDSDSASQVQDLERRMRDRLIVIDRLAREGVSVNPQGGARFPVEEPFVVFFQIDGAPRALRYFVARDGGLFTRRQPSDPWDPTGPLYLAEEEVPVAGQSRLGADASRVSEGYRVIYAAGTNTVLLLNYSPYQLQVAPLSAGLEEGGRAVAMEWLDGQGVTPLERDFITRWSATRWRLLRMDRTIGTQEAQIHLEEFKNEVPAALALYRDPGTGRITVLDGQGGIDGEILRFGAGAPQDEAFREAMDEAVYLLREVDPEVYRRLMETTGAIRVEARNPEQRGAVHRRVPGEVMVNRLAREEEWRDDASRILGTLAHESAHLEFLERWLEEGELATPAGLGGMRETRSRLVNSDNVYDFLLEADGYLSDGESMRKLAEKGTTDLIRRGRVLRWMDQAAEDAGELLGLLNSEAARRGLTPRGRQLLVSLEQRHLVLSAWGSAAQDTAGLEEWTAERVEAYGEARARVLHEAGRMARRISMTLQAAQGGWPGLAQEGSWAVYQAAYDSYRKAQGKWGTTPKFNRVTLEPLTPADQGAFLTEALGEVIRAAEALEVLHGPAAGLLAKVPSEAVRQGYQEYLNPEGFRLCNLLLVRSLRGFAAGSGSFDARGTPRRVPVEKLFSEIRWLSRPNVPSGEPLERGPLIVFFQMEGELPPLHADPDNLFLALDNLLTNIEEAVYGNWEENDTPPGNRAPVPAWVTASREGEGVRILVEDEGPGIPPDILAALRAGDRASTQALEEGHGYGVGTVRRIVEAAGGTFDVGNRTEGGAFFDLHFPAPPSAGLEEWTKERVEAYLRELGQLRHEVRRFSGVITLIRDVFVPQYFPQLAENANYLEFIQSYNALERTLGRWGSPPRRESKTQRVLTPREIGEYLTEESKTAIERLEEVVLLQEEVGNLIGTTSATALSEEDRKDWSRDSFSFGNTLLARMVRGFVNTGGHFDALGSPARLDPARLLQDYHRFVEPIVMAKRELSIRYEEEEDLPEIWADENNLFLAVDNLVRNAARVAGEAGLRNVPLTIRVQRDGEGVAVIVQDRGPGMTPEVLSSIQSGQRTTTQELREEHGIGLSVVRSVVEAAGGRMELESNQSEQDHGTTFTLRFPSAESVLASAGRALGEVMGYLRQDAVASTLLALVDPGRPVTDITDYYPQLAERIRAAGFTRGEAHLVRAGTPASLEGRRFRIYAAGAQAETLRRTLSVMPDAIEIVSTLDEKVDVVIADGSFDPVVRQEFLARGGVFLQVDRDDVAERITPAFLAALAREGLLRPGDFLLLNDLVADDLRQNTWVLIFA